MISRPTSVLPSGRSGRRRTSLTAPLAVVPDRSRHTSSSCQPAPPSSGPSSDRTRTSTHYSTSRAWSSLTCRLSSTSCTTGRSTLHKRSSTLSLQWQKTSKSKASLKTILQHQEIIKQSQSQKFTRQQRNLTPLPLLLPQSVLVQ